MAKKKKKKSRQPEPKTRHADKIKSKSKFKPEYWLIAILMISICLRIFYYVQNSSNNPLFDPPVSDAKVYFDWAKEITSGQIKEGVFYMSPFYPYLIAGIFKLFGESVSSVVIVQHAVGIINLFLIFIISKRVFGQKAAFVALILAALHAPLVFYESKFLLPTFTVLFYLLSLLLLLYQESEKPKFLLSFLTGLVIGIAVIHRPNILLFVPFVLAWFFILHKSSLKPAFILCVLLLIGIALPVSPVTIHNYKASGEFILLTANTGINFYYGANKDAAPTFTRRESVSDSIEQEEEKAREKAETAMGRELSPKEISSYWMKRGFDEITGDFGKWFSYEINKLYWSINTYEIANNYNLPFEKRSVPILKVFFIPFGVMSLLGFLGIVIAPKKDHKVLLLLFYLLSLFIGLMAFTVVSRFRIPLTIILSGFAGYGIIEYISLLKARNFNIEASKKYLLATIVIVVLAFPTLYPYRKNTNPASTYHTLGILAFREGKYEKAIEYQRLAIRTYPPYADAYNNIGSCYKSMGDLDKAIENYDLASDSNPKYAESRFNAGLVYTQKEDFPNAIKKFEKAIEINPKYIKAKAYLAFALFNSGRQNEAIVISKELVQLFPENAVYHHDLGLMQSLVGDLENARKHFQIAIDLDENYEGAKSALKKLNKKKPENIPAD